MQRNAILYKTSTDGKRQFYIDELNSNGLLQFLKEDPAHKKSLTTSWNYY